jgi:hypothetical protein
VNDGLDNALELRPREQARLEAGRACQRCENSGYLLHHVGVRQPAFEVVAQQLEQVG